MLPMVKRHTPSRYLKATGDSISDIELGQILEDDLRDHFGDVKKIAAPEIKLKYKDISYETIHDPDFRKALKKSKIPENRLMELFNEHDAVPEYLEI